MLLFLNAMSHFLVDALCMTTIFSFDVSGTLLTTVIVLYNSIAFSSQCLLGLLIDRVRNLKVWSLISIIITILGATIPFPMLVKTILVGCGNSLFHVVAGTETIFESRGNAGPLGIFVAPGSLGVMLGTQFSSLRRWFSVILVICAVIRVFFKNKKKINCSIYKSTKTVQVRYILLMTIAVAIRAIGGATVKYPWVNSGYNSTLLITIAVFLGKILGGIVCDKIGAQRTAMVSMSISTLCIVFFQNNAVVSLIGQFMLNITMPVTLWLLYLMIPDAPAFAFGLAASALWPGTIAGMLIKLTGPATWIIQLICLGLGFFAIHYSIVHNRVDLEKR